MFLEVSAKTAYQVEEAFKRNAELLLDKIQKGVINLENEVHFANSATWDKKGKCRGD